MTKEQYEKLRNTDDRRRVYSASETPAHLAEAFASDLDRLAQGDGYDE